MIGLRSSVSSALWMCLFGVGACQENTERANVGDDADGAAIDTRPTAKESAPSLRSEDAGTASGPAGVVMAPQLSQDASVGEDVEPRQPDGAVSEGGVEVSSQGDAGQSTPSGPANGGIVVVGTQAPETSPPATEGQAGTDDREEWPAWPMPNPAGLGLPNEHDYALDGDVVADNVTGLVWLRDPGTDEFTRDEVGPHCTGVTAGGFDDWRSPRRIELATLIDFTRQESATDAVFQNMNAVFWTSTPYFGADDNGWTIDFTDGSIGPEYMHQGARAQCVRGPVSELPPFRFTLTNDEVTDNVTGLEWLRRASHDDRTQVGGAQARCADRGNGWRLPSAKELLTLMIPELDRTVFIGPQGDSFWSSSVAVDLPGILWTVSSRGSTAAVNDSATFANVFCVR